jgi:hypothetical protein
MVRKNKGNTIHLYPSHEPQQNTEETKAEALKISSYVNKTANAQNIASFSKTNTNKKTF